jgi:chemotaxis signal transduction protein
MHAGEAVPVVNLATLLDLPCVDTPSIVILLRVEGRHGAIGILVEALGDNPEVPGDRVLPLSALKQSAATVLVEQAIQPLNDHDALVLIVNTAQLGALLFGAAAVAA